MVLRLVCLVLLIGVSSATPLDPPAIETAVAPLPREDNPFRLPEGAVIVDLYEIKLSIDEDTFYRSFKFGGETTITFTNVQTTNEIKIHSNVTISDATLTTESGTPVLLTNEGFVNDKETAILTLTMTTQLTENTKYKLHFIYEGDFRTYALNGFYRSVYIDADGNERVLGTTQFESTSAREVFPCFDEPSYKAQFDISIRHPTIYTAISNTQELRFDDPNDENFTTTTFERTPRMPTYLVAFVVSDFTCSKSVEFIDEDIPHSICSREETAPTRDLALEVSLQLLTALEEFTQIPYSTSTLSKLHQFAIPDFSAGAMENWGLITYREVYLLWDPENSSNSNKQNVITTVTHELAHYWFGNLVTTHWWSDAFLNEGFATYFEYHAAHEIFPSYELDKQFVLSELQPVLVSDASPSSAALSSPVYTPTQIEGRFSSISYNKGGSVLRMVEHFMGLDNFKNGINKYLTDNQFNNTTPEDLWETFQNFAPTDIPTGSTIPTIMYNWTNKPGYPVIYVDILSGFVRFSQTRYLSSGETNSTDEWYIPVSYTTASDSLKFVDTKPRIWLKPGSNFLSDAKLDDDWIILNNQQTGYYRVDYEPQLWNRIKAGLDKPGFDGIHELNRAQLVDDFYNFARNGHKSFVDLLEFLTFLRKDTSYYSWYAGFNAFSYITQRIGNEKLRASVSAYILELVEVLYNSIPFNEAKDDEQIYTLKKTLVIPWVCRLGLQDCINHAVEAFATYRRTEIKPDKNLRTTIFCNALRYGTNVQEDFDFLWDVFSTSKLATEQSQILSALGCAKDEQVLRNYLSKSINSTSGIRQQDALSVFSSVYTNNPEGVDVALDFLIENYEAIKNYYTTMNSISNLFNGLTGRFTKQEQADKFLNFIENGNLGEHAASARTALDNALATLETIAQFEEELNAYFSPPDETSSASTISTAMTILTLLLLCYRTSF